MCSLEEDPPASVAWSRGGSYLAVGLTSGAVALFDGALLPPLRLLCGAGYGVTSSNSRGWGLGRC